MRISDWSSDVCSSDLKLGDVAIALEGFSVAAPIETEGDADNAPLCGPCGGGCIHSGALPGGDKHHMGNARPDLVEPVPDDAPIVPVLRAGDDDDGALRVVSVAPPFRTGAEEIKRRNLAGGWDMEIGRASGRESVCPNA